MYKYNYVYVTVAFLCLGPDQVEYVLEQLKGPERQLKGCTLSAEKWPEVNQIILHGLEEEITKEILETYFRNEDKSGCHTFVDVTMKGRGIAVVTLQDSQGKSRNITIV